MNQNVKPEVNEIENGIAWKLGNRMLLFNILSLSPTIYESFIQAIFN